MPKWPFPLDDGGRIATDALVRPLARDPRISVDLLAIPGHLEQNEEAVIRAAWEVEAVHLVPRFVPKRSWLKFANFGLFLMRYPQLPLTLSYFVRPQVRKRVQTIVERGSWDVMVFDGLHCAALFWEKGGLQRPASVQRIVYRAHNIESDLWRKAPESQKNPLLRRFLRFQSGLMETFERAVLTQVDVVAPISAEDEREVLSMAPRAKTLLTPLGLDFDEAAVPPEPEREPASLLFLGRLDWLPNRDALTWLLEEIWPVVAKRRPDLKLVVAGSGNGDWLSRYRNLPGTELLGFVDSVVPLYHRACASVIPMRFGSGTRIKVIESVKFRRPCISTALGMQGSTLGEDAYIRAEDTESWIETLSTLDVSALPSIADKAFSQLRVHFEVNRVAERLAQTLLTGMQETKTIR